MTIQCNDLVSLSLEYRRYCCRRHNDPLDPNRDWFYTQLKECQGVGRVISIEQAYHYDPNYNPATIRVRWPSERSCGYGSKDLVVIK